MWFRMQLFSLFCGGLGYRFLKNRQKKTRPHKSFEILRGLLENLDGAQGRNRTIDTRIFSPLLYRLSYLGEKRNVVLYSRKLMDCQAKPCVVKMHLFWNAVWFFGNLVFPGRGMTADFPVMTKLWGYATIKTFM